MEISYSYRETLDFMNKETLNERQILALKIHALSRLIRDKNIIHEDYEAKIALLETEGQALEELTRRNASFVREYVEEQVPIAVFEKVLEKKRKALDRLNRMKEKRGSA